MTSKLIAILCMMVVFALGISCHLHAEPHTHSIPIHAHDGHHDETTPSTDEDITCIAAVIPSMSQLIVISSFKHDLTFSAVKPLVPVFELYIPPRSSL